MLPPQRVSHGRTRRRRNHHALEAQNLATDPISGSPRLSHRAAAESGYVRAGLTIKVPKLGIGVPKSKKKK